MLFYVLAACGAVGGESTLWLSLSSCHMLLCPMSSGSGDPPGSCYELQKTTRVLLEGRSDGMTVICVVIRSG